MCGREFVRAHGTCVRHVRVSVCARANIAHNYTLRSMSDQVCHDTYCRECNFTFLCDMLLYISFDMSVYMSSDMSGYLQVNMSQHMRSGMLRSMALHMSLHMQACLPREHIFSYIYYYSIFILSAFLVCT